MRTTFYDSRYNPDAKTDLRGYAASRRSLLRLMSTATTASLLTTPLAIAGNWLALVSGPAIVEIENFAFSPAELTVPQGTTVIWVNDDDVPHTVVETSKIFRSKPIDTDDTFAFTFATAGRFDYFCSVHPHMTGRIVVAEGAG